MPIARSNRLRRALVAGLWVVALAVVGGCRPPHHETAQELQPAARSWAEAHGLPLASDEALEGLVGGATVVALGEAAHGSLDVFDARVDMTKRLIELGWAKAIVLENDAWWTCRVDRYVHGLADDPAVLRGSLIGLYQHDAAFAFFEWLRDFNRDAAQPVAVYGMDAQSDAACTMELAACRHRAELCAQAKTLRSARASVGVRDELMATNVLRVLDEVGSGLVLWVHSGHASKSASLLAWNVRKGGAPMGHHLASELGAQYVVANVTLATGRVTATNTGGRLLRLRYRRELRAEEFELAPAPPTTLEGTLAADQPTVYPLAELTVGTDATGWFSKPHFGRSIGSDLSGWRAKNGSAYVGWTKMVPRESFDTIVVVPQSRAIDFDF